MVRRDLLDKQTGCMLPVAGTAEQVEIRDTMSVVVEDLVVHIDAVQTVHVESLHFAEDHKIHRTEEPEGVGRNLRLAGMETVVVDILHTADLDLVNHHTEEGVERRNLPVRVNLRIEVAEGDSCCNHS